MEQPLECEPMDASGEDGQSHASTIQIFPGVTGIALEAPVLGTVMGQGGPVLASRREQQMEEERQAARGRRPLPALGGLHRFRAGDAEQSLSAAPPFNHQQPLPLPAGLWDPADFPERAGDADILGLDLGRTVLPGGRRSCGAPPFAGPGSNTRPAAGTERMSGGSPGLRSGATLTASREFLGGDRGLGGSDSCWASEELQGASAAMQEEEEDVEEGPGLHDGGRWDEGDLDPAEALPFPQLGEGRWRSAWGSQQIETAPGPSSHLQRTSRCKMRMLPHSPSRHTTTRRQAPAEADTVELDCRRAARGGMGLVGRQRDRNHAAGAAFAAESLHSGIDEMFLDSVSLPEVHTAAAAASMPREVAAGARRSARQSLAASRRLASGPPFCSDENDSTSAPAAPSRLERLDGGARGAGWLPSFGGRESTWGSWRRRGPSWRGDAAGGAAAGGLAADDIPSRPPEARQGGRRQVQQSWLERYQALRGSMSGDRDRPHLGSTERGRLRKALGALHLPHDWLPENEQGRELGSLVEGSPLLLSEGARAAQQLPPLQGFAEAHGRSGRLDSLRGPDLDSEVQQSLPEALPASKRQHQVQAGRPGAPEAGGRASPSEASLHKRSKFLGFGGGGAAGPGGPSRPGHVASPSGPLVSSARCAADAFLEPGWDGALFDQEQEGEESGGTAFGPVPAPTGQEDAEAGAAHRRAAVEAMQPDEPHLDLNEDLLHHVFSILNTEGLCRAALVCRSWQLASEHEDFWRALDLEGRRVSRADVARLCAKYPRATSLNLRSTVSCDEQLARGVLARLAHLEELLVGGAHDLTDGFFLALEDCAALRSIHITDAVLGSGGPQEIQVRHERVQELAVTRCRVMLIAIRCMALRRLTLHKSSVSSVLLTAPALLDLDLSSCNKLSDAGLRSAVTGCSRLRRLSIANCANVTDETLREVAGACPDLAYLDASGCPVLTLESVRLPALVELRLVACFGITAASCSALNHSLLLEDVRLDGCLLPRVALDLPRLRSASFANCKILNELELRCPHLTTLVTENCRELQAVDLASGAIEVLEMRGRLHLCSLTLGCPRLRHLDLSECDALNDRIFDIFKDPRGCPQLKTFILDNCEKLAAVDLASPQLRALSLTGCRTVSSVRLQCPRLNSLQLDGCDRLATACLVPVALAALNLSICHRLCDLELDAPLITSLDLRSCGALRSAKLSCPSLTLLDASNCSQLSDNVLAELSLACPALVTLVLAGCYEVGPGGLRALAASTHLRVLDLSYTFLTELEAVYDACASLQVLRLSACKYLQDGALQALHHGRALPGLQELDISFGALSQAAIEDLLMNCPHLRQVSLNACSHITESVWDCISATAPSRLLPGGRDQALEVVPADLLVPAQDESGDMETDTGVSDGGGGPIPAAGGAGGKGGEDQQPRQLQQLSCVGCQNLRKVVIPHAAACARLAHLNLSLANHLEEVILACPHLLSLNLSNCTALSFLELECPRLTSLCLQGCSLDESALKAAVRGCGMLETLDVRNCPKIPSNALNEERHRICPSLRRLYNTLS